MVTTMGGHVPTLQNSDFHSIKTNYAIHSLDRSLKIEQISERDNFLIKEFAGEIMAYHNISKVRVNKIVFHLVGWRRFIGPFAENSTGDLLCGINRLHEARNSRGTLYKQNTIRDFVTILKQFYGWLIENGHSDIPEEKVRKIRVPSKDRMTKTAADMLSPEEIEMIIGAAGSIRDKALIMTLYEGGLRVGEIGSLTWGALVFDEHGVVANVNFKTNKPRYIRLVMAREPLIRWRAMYPFQAADDNLVFLNRSNRPMTYAAVRALLMKTAGRAGVTRHVTPHTFRHSRITHMIQEGYPESVIKLIMWGSVEASEWATYAHLTGCDIDRAVLEKNGVATNEETWKGVEGEKCPYCGILNPPAARYCYQCGRPLVVEDTVSELKKLLTSNPAVVQVLLETINGSQS